MRNLKQLAVLITTSLLFITLNGCANQQPSLSHDKALIMAVAQPPVIKWATEAALSAFNYDYQNYQQQQKNTSRYFMPDAWTNYMTALTASGNLNQVINSKGSVSAVVSSNSVTISNIGLVQGKATWIVQVPLDVTYHEKHSSYEQHVVVTMYILEVPNSPTHQVAINQFIVQ